MATKYSKYNSGDTTCYVYEQSNGYSVCIYNPDKGIINNYYDKEIALVKSLQKAFDIIKSHSGSNHVEEVD